MKLNKKSSSETSESPRSQFIDLLKDSFIIKADDEGSAKEDGIIIEEVKEEPEETGEPRKKYDPKRQEFVMMYVIQKGATAAAV